MYCDSLVRSLAAVDRTQDTALREYLYNELKHNIYVGKGNVVACEIHDRGEPTHRFGRNSTCIQNKERKSAYMSPTLRCQIL